MVNVLPEVNWIYTLYRIAGYVVGGTEIGGRQDLVVTLERAAKISVHLA